MLLLERIEYIKMLVQSGKERGNVQYYLLLIMPHKVCPSRRQCVAVCDTDLDSLCYSLVRNSLSIHCLPGMEQE